MFNRRIFVLRRSDGSFGRSRPFLRHRLRWGHRALYNRGPSGRDSWWSPNSLIGKNKILLKSAFFSGRHSAVHNWSVILILRIIDMSHEFRVSDSLQISVIRAIYINMSCFRFPDHPSFPISATKRVFTIRRGVAYTRRHTFNLSLDRGAILVRKGLHKLFFRFPRSRPAMKDFDLAMLRVREFFLLVTQLRLTRDVYDRAIFSIVANIFRITLKTLEQAAIHMFHLFLKMSVRVFHALFKPIRNLPRLVMNNHCFSRTCRAFFQISGDVFDQIAWKKNERILRAFVDRSRWSWLAILTRSGRTIISLLPFEDRH